MTPSSDDYLGALKTLHLRLVDAAHGYKEAGEQTDDRDMATLFAEMARFRHAQSGQTSALLAGHGADPDKAESWMSLLQRGIMQVRGLFGTLGPEALDPVVAGERRIADLYGEAIAAAPGGVPDPDVLTGLRRDTIARIADLEARRP